MFYSRTQLCLAQGYSLRVSRKHKRKNIAGKRVAVARHASVPPLTQDALSGRLARLGVQLDRAAIAKIENDLRYVLDFEVRALARALDVDIGWLLADEQK